ncbi:MAG: hypothetical protein ACUVQM_02940 [Candidatus Hadarchaeaceae archaeon]
MRDIEIIYIIFLLGSLAFGLEAMFFGFGGKLLLFFRRRRGTILLVAFGLGAIIVAAGFEVSKLFHLEPIYFVFLVLLFSFIVGGAIRTISNNVNCRTPPPLPESTDEELEKIISARGYSGLLKSSGRKRKRTKIEKI